MVEQIGYSLIVPGSSEVQFWGDTPGQSRGVPDFIKLPNGDDVHCPVAGETYGEWKLVPRMWEDGPASLTVGMSQVLVGRPAPAPIKLASCSALVRFTVAGGLITATIDTLGVSSILRVTAGRYRIYYETADPDKRNIAGTPTILNALPRFGRITARNTNYTEIQITDPLGALSDVSEVTVNFTKLEQRNG